MSFEKTEAQARRLRHQLQEYIGLSQQWKASLDRAHNNSHDPFTGRGYVSHQDSEKHHMQSVDEAIRRLTEENALLAQQLGQLNADQEEDQGVEEDEDQELNEQGLYEQTFVNELISQGKTPDDITTDRDEILLKKSYIGLKTVLNSLPYEPTIGDPISIILARNDLENVISTSRATLSTLKIDQAKLNQDLNYDSKLNAELTEINRLLKERLNKLNIETVNDDHPENDIKINVDKLEKKISSENEKAAKFMGYLNHVLNANILTEVINEEEGYHMGSRTDSTSRKLTEIRELVEDLLNALFDSSTERYILPHNPDAPIIRLLLQADLIIQNPKDPRYVKLRDYNECFE